MLAGQLSLITSRTPTSGTGYATDLTHYSNAEEGTERIDGSPRQPYSDSQTHREETAVYKLQALVYDILPWRKVPESDARSVGCEEEERRTSLGLFAREVVMVPEIQGR